MNYFRFILNNESVDDIIGLTKYEVTLVYLNTNSFMMRWFIFTYQLNILQQRLLLFNNTKFTDDVIPCYNTEYSSHALPEVVYGKHKNDWILITISKTGKLWYYQDWESKEDVWQMVDFCVLYKIHMWINRVETRDMKDKNNTVGPGPPSNHSF